MQEGADEGDEEEKEEHEYECRNDDTGSAAGADGKSDKHVAGESAKEKVMCIK
jgi:hypothetical protein